MTVFQDWILTGGNDSDWLREVFSSAWEGQTNSAAHISPTGPLVECNMSPSSITGNSEGRDSVEKYGASGRLVCTLFRERRHQYQSIDDFVLH